ncbi:hypothetical protein HRI_001854800 [Hibiscus trionum]|uniref:At2g35280-like TPR domain-containing protein n=1 Tax=Hibiscus trionum TaxID=183268 RepID=A0A9W7HPS1_HIBTR|nr:hypothetical protein HRI_001854800 [Hibiscus trionum]
MTTNIRSNIVGSLPQEMLSEILTHVASNSITDFVNFRLSCKAFLEASNHAYIFGNVSLEKFDFIPRTKSEENFQNLCKAANNPEALYRRGMIDCFSRRKPKSGLRWLRKATERGHVEAIYTYGIILICFGGKLREEGHQVVKSLGLVKFNKTSLRIVVGCRSKTEKAFSRMWVYVGLPSPKQVDCGCDRERPKCRGSRMDQAWQPSNLCTCYDSCFWDHEATLFSNLVGKYLIQNHSVPGWLSTCK